MAEDLIRYDIVIQDALRGAVKKILTEVTRTGLPGEHHFYIAFDTNAPGVRISNRLHERYPQEMTIVLQHQFWDLAVTDHYFEVGLSFGGIPERLVIPFSAVKGFFDPSVQFALEFEPGKTAEELPDELREAIEEEAAAEETLEKLEALTDSREIPGSQANAQLRKAEEETVPRKDDETKKGAAENGADVVSLDAFRKKT